MTDTIYTVAALAKRWGTSDTFVYTLLNSGKLEGIKLGAKLWRIKSSAVDRYEEQQMIEPKPLAAQSA